MAVITELPLELVAHILRSLDETRCLQSSILTCRHLYSSFREYPSIVADVILRQVPPVILSYAIAVEEASSIPPPDSALSVQYLLTLHDAPSLLVAKLRSLPLPVLFRIGEAHRIMDSMEFECAEYSWAQAVERNPNLPPLKLSLEEQICFCLAFRRFDFFYGIFSGDDVDESELIHIANR